MNYKKILGECSEHIAVANDCLSDDAKDSAFFLGCIMTKIEMIINDMTDHEEKEDNE